MISTRPVTLKKHNSDLHFPVCLHTMICWRIIWKKTTIVTVERSGDHKTMLSNFKRIKLWCLCGGRNTGMQKAWYKQPVHGEWVSLIRLPDHWTAPKTEVYLFQCLCRARTRNASEFSLCPRYRPVQRFSRCWQVSLHFHSTNCFHFFWLLKSQYRPFWTTLSSLNTFHGQWST